MQALNKVIFSIALLLPLLAFAQPGDNCGNAVGITLPYCGTNQGTCGFNNDFNGSLPCNNLPPQYTAGPDVFYSFTATANGTINLNMSNTSNLYYGTMAVFTGCPNSMTNPTNCIGCSAGSNILTVTVTVGQTYYVLVDGETAPNCYAFDLCIAPPPSAPLQPPCTNLGFENGLQGWFGTTGHVTVGTGGATSPNYVINSLNTFGMQTTVMTSGIDSFGQFPCVFAGSQSIQLGDATGTAAQGASIEQYFQVTANNTNFTYNYACVLEDGGHPNTDQPFFWVEVFDQNDNPITCGNYLVTAPGTGWTLSNTAAYGIYDVYYKPWTSVSINLLPYVGQNIRVRFITGDCVQGAHFGYAYIDCSCAPYLINPDSICQGQTATLTAPAGAQSYSWSPGGQTTQVINVSPATTTVYTCTITSYGVSPCVGTYTAQVVVSPSPTVTVNSGTFCPGGSVTLNANGATTYSWTPATGLSASTGSTVSASPSATSNYSVIGTSAGCADTAVAVVTVSPMPTITVNSPSVCAGDPAVLTASGAASFTWAPAIGLSSTTGTVVTAAVNTNTTYTITGSTGTCTSSATAIVTVNALPTLTVNSASVCPGASATLNAGGATTYSWTPAIGLSSGTGASVTASPSVTTTYTIIGSSAAGCNDTTTATVTLAGNLSPAVNNGAICTGNSITLSASGATTYSWSPAAGLSSTSGASVTANPTTTTTYTIIASSGNCTGTVTAVVTVNPLPTITVSSATFCAGQQATLNANGASTYNWSPATGLSSAAGSNVIASPGGSANYTVSGTDGNGCIGTALAVVTVNPLPTVTVNNALLCTGDSAGLSAGGANTYSWTPALGLSATFGANVIANPGTTTIYSVTGIDANGCLSANTATVAVVTNPILTVNSLSLCTGNPGQLTVNGASQYSWLPATGLSSTTGGSVIVNPATTTIYTVTGTVGSCTAVATTTVTVNALPQVTASSATVCLGGAAAIAAGGALSYSWSTGVNTSGITVAPVTNTSYTVVGSDVNGCVNLAIAMVTVNSLPVVSVNSATICVGNTATLIATGASNYAWNPPTALNTGTGPLVFSNPLNNITYTVTGTDNNNCRNTAVSNVIVNPLPVLQASSATVCAGSAATLTVSGAINYSWSPSTGLSSANSANPNAAPVATSIYTITGIDANGCSATINTSVVVDPLPVINIGPALTAGCAPVCVTFSNNAFSGGQCNWNFGDGTSSTSCTAPHCFTKPGTFNPSYMVTDDNGCTNSGTATVIVYPVPTADFYFDPQPVSVLSPEITFTNASFGANIISMNWNFGDATSSAQTNPVHEYAIAGSYAVQLIVSSDHGCKDTIIKIINIDEEISIYVPNAFSPNGDGVNEVFSAKGEGIKEFHLYVYDRWGNKVFYTENMNSGWNGTYRTDEVVQEDVYVWKIIYKGKADRERELSGTVTLIK